MRFAADEVAVQVVVEVDPHPAVDVHGGVRDPVSGIGRPELRRGDLGVGGESLGEPPRGLPQREADRPRRR